MQSLKPYFLLQFLRKLKTPSIEWIYWCDWLISRGQRAGQEHRAEQLELPRTEGRPHIRQNQAGVLQIEVATYENISFFYLRKIQYFRYILTCSALVIPRTIQVNLGGQEGHPSRWRPQSRDKKRQKKVKHVSNQDSGVYWIIAYSCTVI